MKKLICLVLAAILCMTTLGALAEEATPSKTTGDLTHFTVTAENQPEDGNLFLRPVIDEESEEYQERLTICEKEIEKLAASESPEKYFGNVVNMTDMSGNIVTLKDLMEENELNVFEFCPLIAGGFQEECGKVTAEMLFSTPYEEGERVLVMIGLVTVQEDGTQTVEWRAFEGIGLSADGATEYAGRIQVELDAETVLAIQEGIALLAIISA